MSMSVDLKQALLDPESIFAGPEEVCDNAELTTAQKIEILRRWEYDAHELEVAEEALVQANKQFDMQFYPNKNHGIYGGNTSFHLYTRMTEFVLENL